MILRNASTRYSLQSCPAGWAGQRALGHAAACSPSGPHHPRPGTGGAVHELTALHAPSALTDSASFRVGWLHGRLSARPASAIPPASCAALFGDTVLFLVLSEARSKRKMSKGTQATDIIHTFKVKKTLCLKRSPNAQGLWEIFSGDPGVLCLRDSISRTTDIPVLTEKKQRNHRHPPGSELYVDYDYTVLFPIKGSNVCAVISFIFPKLLRYRKS